MIELKNVSKRYKTGTHALSDVSFTVEDGEFVFVMGPSGAGKSTLVKLLDGEEVPTSGKVIVSGVDVGRLKKSKVYLYRRKIGVVFQDFKLLPKKTVFENIAYALEVLDMPTDKIRKRVRDVLKLVDLSDKSNALPESLSGGQQQRVAIARSVVKRPMIIIADEPTGNLDPNMTNEMIELLEKINRDEKTTIIVVTHNLTTVENHPKRTIVIENGHIVSDSIYKPKPKPKPVEEKPVVEEVVEPLADGKIFSGVKDDEDNDEDQQEKRHHISLEPDDIDPLEDLVLETDSIKPVETKTEEVEVQPETVEQTKAESEIVNHDATKQTEIVEETMAELELAVKQESKQTPVEKSMVEISVETKDNQPEEDAHKANKTEVENTAEKEMATEIADDDFTEQLSPVTSAALEADDDFTEQLSPVTNAIIDADESSDDDFTEQLSPIIDIKFNDLTDDEYVIEDFTSTNQIVADNGDQDVLQTALNEMNETIEMFKQNNKE